MEVTGITVWVAVATAELTARKLRKQWHGRTAKMYANFKLFFVFSLWCHART
jgi:hypothetical protein